MNFILERLAVGSYEEALNPPPTISALLNVAMERDLHDAELLYHKIPIVDMKPIPAGQMKEAVEWIWNPETQPGQGETLTPLTPNESLWSRFRKEMTPPGINKFISPSHR